MKRTEPKGKIQELFPLSSGRKLCGAFDGCRLSTFGGAPLLRMVEQGSGYVEAVSSRILDWRTPHLVKYSIPELVWQRVALICAGFSDTIDSNYLRHDPAILLALGIDVGEGRHLASQPTISRLENNMSIKDCYRMAECMVRLYIASKKKPPKEIILDLDGSSFETHGNQQNSSYRSHWERNMYFPLFVYDQDGWLICAILRPGWDGEARLTVPVLKKLVREFREAWPEVKIIVRMDSAFGSPEIYDWCEEQGKDDKSKTVYYIVCFKSSNDRTGVSAEFKDCRDQAKRHFGKKCGPPQYAEEGAKKKWEVEKAINALPRKERKEELKRLRSRFVRVFGNGYYRAGQGKKKWRDERRIVAVITHDDWGCVSRYFVTNMPEKHDPQYLIEDVYSRRGAMELRIKEYRALEGDKLSCRDFTPNQVRLMFHALAQNTIFMLRRQLPRPRQTWSFDSIQKYLLRLAVKVTQTARRTTLHWPSDYQWKREFWTCHRRLLLQVMHC